jgi:hypothetical protein
LISFAIFGLLLLYATSIRDKLAFADPATFITTIPANGSVADTKGCVAERVRTEDPTAIYRATVTVLGVVWPEQVRVVELSLKAIPGARAVKFDMGDGIAVVDFAPGVKVSEACIRHVISADSLSAGQIKFSALSFAGAPYVAPPAGSK